MLAMSICIPTYEMNGLGAQYLKHQFDIFVNQTVQNFEVVVSDHSKNDDIEKLCKQYAALHNKYGKFSTVYVRNENNEGNSSANANNAIRHSNTDIVKIMFQDDYLFTKDAIEKMIVAFSVDCSWLIVGSTHTTTGQMTFNPMIPKYNDQIHLGNNTISSPSVLAMRKGVFFDENLIWLMDVELYKRLHDAFGLPKILEDCLVVNRIGESQLSHTIPE